MVQRGETVLITLMMEILSCVAQKKKQISIYIDNIYRLVYCHNSFKTELNWTEVGGDWLDYLGGWFMINFG